MTVFEAFAKRWSLALTAAIVLTTAVPVAAQWLKHPDPRIPRMPDG
jgi:hypothetical protein